MNSVLKYILKVSSGVFLYFIFRIPYLEENDGLFELDENSLFYMIFTVIQIFLVWEVNDRVYAIFKNRYKERLFVIKNILIYQVTLFLTATVVLAIGMYFQHYYLSPWLGCELKYGPLQAFLKDFTISLIFALLFNIAYLIILFINFKKDADIKQERIHKKNLLFKYESLRNQIDPHFLFNSFSVLNTLIQTNTQMASEFLNKLAELYRYILDNRHNNLSPVYKELQCLQAYMFLMKIRHEDCIVDNINVEGAKLKKRLPTMALQMLIENAIKHNSFSEKHPLHVEIAISENYIEVKNSLRTRKSTKISAGIGLENIKKRYEHHTQQQVVIEKNTEEFIVKLPLL